MDVKYIVRIQALWRGYVVRKSLQTMYDGFTKVICREYLEHYIAGFKLRQKINKQLQNKKCRNENFPSEISENICKFALFKRIGIMPNWDTQTGDIDLCKKKVEVKGFMSCGPSSFGPTEKWDYICFVDARGFLDMHFKVYMIKLKNTSEEWRNLKLTKLNSYGDIADANRRGQLRCCFYNVVYPQLNEHIQLVFDGHFDDL
jgi:hypothetical protein